MSTADSVNLKRRAILFGLCTVSALAGAEAMRPRTYLSKVRTPIDLKAQVPTKFADWTEQVGATPLLPDPELQERLDALYTQILARTYVNSQGQRVMLSIAYGSDQSSEATAVHRPEFCYSAQGFSVANEGLASIPMAGGKQLAVQRLLAQQGSRVEPVSYWITLDTQATLPGMGRKLAQLRYGLKGEIADGMLVRVSNFSTVGDLSKDFALQAAFVEDFRLALPLAVRPRYFGS